jgi:hypothetical protein
MSKRGLGSRQQDGARGRRRRASALAVLALAVPVLVGCTTTIVAPCGSPPRQTVYVLDHGRTSSLALPDEAGGFVRYVYGDWRWYALNETTVSVGIAALLWPTQGALGRAALPSRFTADGGAAVAYEQLHALEVEAQRLRELRRRLDDLYSANALSRVYNALYDLDFVPYPMPYSVLYNSNHVIAAWLEELGCEVRGPALWSQWRVQRPD